MTRVRALGLILLTLTGIYLYAFPSATIPYLGIVLGHIAGGLVFALVLLMNVRQLRQQGSAAITGWIFIAIGTALGIIVAFTGATRPLTPLLYAHIFICATTRMAEPLRRAAIHCSVATDIPRRRFGMGSPKCRMARQVQNREPRHATGVPGL
jgi:hypothetical protein